MSDIKRILPEGEQPDKEIAYVVAIVERLEPVVGPWLDERECLALLHVLTYTSFVWDDGFGINGPDDPSLWDPADVVECFSEDRGLVGRRLKTAYANGYKGMYQVAEDLTKRILSDRSIKLRE